MAINDNTIGLQDILSAVNALPEAGGGGSGGGGAVSGGTGVTKTVAGAILIPVLVAGVAVTLPASMVATSATGELNS